RVSTTLTDTTRRSIDICKERPGWNVFQDGCPRGESPAHVADRADRLIAELSALNGNAALFSHGEFGCVLAARWIALPAADGQHFSLGPASLSILGHRAGHPDVRIIALWNADPASPPGGP
ncbi:MAG: histidine phosphatase family protein, partial [Pseudomonadota bacterium]|nr:histidine phosphatase family protein [Pseudomonadota bacterium]